MCFWNDTTIGWRRRDDDIDDSLSAENVRTAMKIFNRSGYDRYRHPSWESRIFYGCKETFRLTRLKWNARRWRDDARSVDVAVVVNSFVPRGLPTSYTRIPLVHTYEYLLLLMLATYCIFCFKYVHILTSAGNFFWCMYKVVSMGM